MPGPFRKGGSGRCRPVARAASACPVLCGHAHRRGRRGQETQQDKVEMMLNPVPANSATESPWAQLLRGGAAAAGARGAVADSKDGVDAKDEATPVQVEQAVRQANEVLAVREVGVRFEVDKDTEMLIVKVVDSSSGEVIRQIPNEEAVRIAKLMNDGNGLLVDQAA